MVRIRTAVFFSVFAALLTALGMAVWYEGIQPARSDRHGEAQFKAGRRRAFDSLATGVLALDEDSVLWPDGCVGEGCSGLPHGLDPERYASDSLNRVRNCVVSEEVPRRFGIALETRGIDFFPQEQDGYLTVMDSAASVRYGATLRALRQQIARGELAVNEACRQEGLRFRALRSRR